MSATQLPQTAIDEIQQIGMERAPDEACGVWHPVAGVVELLNRSSTPERGYIVEGVDLSEALDYLGLLDEPDQDLVVWHTHPSGHVGPSEGDLATRDTLCGMPGLVVSLPNGEAVTF